MGSNQTYKFCTAKENISKQKDNPQNEKKKLQMIWLTRVIWYDCKWAEWQDSSVMTFPIIYKQIIQLSNKK